MFRILPARPEFLAVRRCKRRSPRERDATQTGAYIPVMSRRTWTAAAPSVYDAVMRPVEASMLARWRNELWDRIPRDGVGLEIGAGSGASVPYRRGRRTIDTDLSPAMLRRGRESNGGGTPAVAASVEALPFASGRFDWVTASLVFCEVADPAAGLGEALRVLRPGGTVHLLEHVEPRGWLGGAARLVTRVTGRLLGEHFDRRTWELVENAGFRVEHAHRGLRGALLHVVGRKPVPDPTGER